MRILEVASFFKPSWEAGGIARVSYELSKRLSTRHEVVVYTTDGFKSRLNIKKNRPIEVEGMSVYYFRNLSNFLARRNLCIPYLLPHIVKKDFHRFDIIHVHTFRTILAILIWYYAKKYEGFIKLLMSRYNFFCLGKHSLCLKLCDNLVHPYQFLYPRVLCVQPKQFGIPYLPCKHYNLLLDQLRP